MKIEIIILAAIVAFLIPGIIVLTQHYRALRKYGHPTLPLIFSHFYLGELICDTTELENVFPKVKEKWNKKIFGEAYLHSLFRGSVENDDGSWGAEIEIRENEVVGYWIDFKSSIDSRLNKSWGNSDNNKAYYLQDHNPG